MKEMKKKLCFTLILLTSIAVSNAQIAEWVIPPNYDNMYIPEGTNLIVSDSLGQYTSLWNLDGIFINYVDGDIQTFHNGVAVTTDSNNNNILGFISSSGAFFSPQKGHFIVARSYPFFSDGYLLVKDSETRFYQYIDKSGKPSEYLYEKGYPFFNSYASCCVFENQEKLKKPIPCLLTTDMKAVEFTFRGKSIKNSNVDFISSVNDDHVAIVIVNRKIYIFRAGIDELSPLCSKENTDNLKEQAKMHGDLYECLHRENDSTWILNARSGKEKIIIYFDEFMKPRSIYYTDRKKVFPVHENPKAVRESPLRVLSGADGKGLLWGKEEMLAPQFEEVLTCVGNKAIVRKGGKYGLIRVSRDMHFDLTIDDKGEKIPFLHKNYKTRVRVDFPSSIPSEKVSIKLDTVSEWIIDKTSIQSVNTPSGNYIQYNCILHFPQILFDQDSAVVNYPVQIIYDGFVSPVINVLKDVWFYRNWCLAENPQGVLNEGKYTFDFRLKAARQDDNLYQTKVEVLPNSTQPDSLYPELLCELRKHTETDYRCTVTGLDEGLNEITVEVTEDGLPTTSIPIIITYTKKIAPTIEEPKKIEEEVIIEAKDPKPVRKKSRTQRKRDENDGKPKLEPLKKGW